MYLQHKINPSAIAEKNLTLYRLSLNKFYFDDIYDRVFVVGCRRLARQIVEIDRHFVDGVVNLTGLVAIASGEGFKYLETGRVQFYILTILLTVFTLLLFGT